MQRHFPAEWARFAGGVPPAERDGRLVEAYARLLADPDEAVRERAARDWCAWEDTHVSLFPEGRHNPRYDDPAFRMTFARLVTHYWRHDCFLEDGVLLREAGRLAGIPGVMVHGRLDVSGPRGRPLAAQPGLAGQRAGAHRRRRPHRQRRDDRGHRGRHRPVRGPPLTEPRPASAPQPAARPLPPRYNSAVILSP